MAFRSMDEFRSALADLIGQQARPNGRARRNMAIRKHGAEFDTVEELLAYEQAMGLVGAPKRTRKKSSTKRSARKKSAPRAPSGFAPTLAGRKPKKVKHKDALPSYSQGKQIGMAVGGLAAYCPNAVGMRMSHSEVLGGMGLTRQKASRVMDALKEAGLLGPNAQRPKRAQAARRILETVGGVTCPTHAVANPGSYMIPLSPPERDWQWSEGPPKANWTSYPQYAYDVFYRANPAPECPTCHANPGDPCVTSSGKKKSRVHATRARVARENGNAAVGAKFVPDKFPDNAGPYLPEMFPYGQGGVSGCYKNPRKPATKKRREKAAEAGLTLSGGTAWPVYDREHALIALRYMAAGFGGDRWRGQYPKMVRRLARIYPLEDDRNRDIWTYYRQVRALIGRQSKKKMPTPAELRRTVRAAANPKKRKKSKKRRR